MAYVFFGHFLVQKHNIKVHFLIRNRHSLNFKVSLIKKNVCKAPILWKHFGTLVTGIVVREQRNSIWLNSLPNGIKSRSVLHPWEDVVDFSSTKEIEGVRPF